MRGASGQSNVPAVPDGGWKKRKRGCRGGRRKRRNAPGAVSTAAGDVSIVANAGCVGTIHPSLPVSGISDANDAGRNSSDLAIYSNHDSVAKDNVSLPIPGQAANATPAQCNNAAPVPCLPTAAAAATAAGAESAGDGHRDLGEFSVAGHDRFLAAPTVANEAQESPVDWSGMSDAEMLECFNQLQSTENSTVSYSEAAASLVHCQVVAPHAPVWHTAPAFQCWIEDGKIAVHIPTGVSATLSISSGMCSIQCLPDGGTVCRIQSVQALPY